MELTRSIKVSIEKDTNKGTYRRDLKLGEYDEDESISEFMDRVNEEMEELLDQ